MTERKLKSGIDGEKLKLNRVEVSVQIRKTKRDELVNSRREEDTKHEGAKQEVPSQYDFQEALRIIAVSNCSHLRDLSSNLCDDGSSPLSISNSDFQVVPTTIVRRMLEVENNSGSINDVVKSGIIPYIVGFLKQDVNHPLVLESVFILGNIATGDRFQTKHLLDHQAIPELVRLLKSANRNLAIQCAWALTNIVANSVSNRDAMLKHCVVPTFIHLCNGADFKELRILYCAMVKSVSGNPCPSFEIVKPVMELFRWGLAHSDAKVVEYSCTGLHMINGDDDAFKIQAVIELGVCPVLVNLLAASEPRVRLNSLKTLINIIGGNDLQCQTLLNCGVLPALRVLARDPEIILRKTVYFALSNIAKGSLYQMQALLNAGLLPDICAASLNDKADVKLECLYCFDNLLCRGEILVQVAIGPVITAICEMLTSSDVTAVMLAMDSLEKVLKYDEHKYVTMIEECGGLKHLEALRTSENEVVNDQAESLLTRYFSESDEIYPMVPTNFFAQKSSKFT